MEKLIYLVYGTSTAWDTDSGWDVVAAFANREDAERYADGFGNQRPETDFFEYAAYVTECKFYEEGVKNGNT